MNKYKAQLWLLAAVVLAICVTTYTLSYIVTQPWHIMTELGADGGKNNYTYLYQSLYGNGLWFQGMNYPYGEHIVYTDGQPILSVPLSYFKTSIGTALTVMWWLISLSYVLAIVYLYKTLTYFKVQPLLAMCFAAFIVMYTPQQLKLSGHYALSYTCVIPMLFYWTVQYYARNQWKYPAYILLMGIITSFLHPYFAAVILVWTGFYTVGYLLLRREQLLLKVKHLAPLLAAVAGIFLVFGVFMRITDPIHDRPVTPFGILENCTHPRDVFSSIYSPLWWQIEHNGIYKRVSFGGEGYTYLGLATMFIVGCSVLFGIINKVKKAPGNTIVHADGFQPIWLFVAVASLLFGMGAPFTWHMQWLLEYASMLKQFRTLGRFSWIFYYVITTYGAVVVSYWYSRSISANKKGIAIIAVLLPVALWCYEIKDYVNRTRASVARSIDNYNTFVSNGTQSWAQFLAAHKYSRDSFQAIIVLRFFEVGSEKLWLGHNEEVSAWTVALGVQSSYQLHLPMMDCMMSRTSWAQAFNQVKIAGGPYTDKPVLNDIKSNKPFLLLTVDVEPVEPDQQYLLEASDSIGHYRNCTVYACYPDRIKANDKRYKGQAIAAAGAITSGDTCIKQTGGWFTEHFDTGNVRLAFFGTGGAQYDSAATKDIVTAPVTPAYDKQLYEFSCWFLTPGDNFKSPYCVVEMLDSARQIIATQGAATKEATDTRGLWMRNHAYFAVPGNTRYIRCKVLKDADHSYFAMDELLLMPADAVILSKAKDGTLLVNNHIVSTQK